MWVLSFVLLARPVVLGKCDIQVDVACPDQGFSRAMLAGAGANINSLSFELIGVEFAWYRNSIVSGQWEAQTMEDIHLLRILWIFVSSFGPMPWFRTHAQTSSAPQPIRQRSQPLPPVRLEVGGIEAK